MRDVRVLTLSPDPVPEFLAFSVFILFSDSVLFVTVEVEDDDDEVESFEVVEESFVWKGFTGVFVGGITAFEDDVVVEELLLELVSSDFRK